MLKKLPISLLALAMLLCTEAKSQTTFSGSFMMVFESDSKDNQNFPFQWVIQDKNAGGRMGMEIQDDMKKRGVTKRVIFDPADSTWSMLMLMNNLKYGTKVHRAEMFRKNKLKQELSIHTTKEKKTIDGFVCKKVILESKDYHSELWLTEKFDFNICQIYRLLSHCGMMNGLIRKGDWYNWTTNKGMILAVDCLNKKTKERYSVKITSILSTYSSPGFFDLKGYKLSEIAEGQSCGVTVDEK